MFLFLEILKSEHLTTKKKIENVREMFGEDNWLHSHAGSYVQDILGIKQQSDNESFSEEVPVQILFLNVFILHYINNKIMLFFNFFFIGRTNY